MVISQPALICLGATTGRVRRWLAVRGSRRQDSPSGGTSDVPGPRAAGPILETAALPVAEPDAAANAPLTPDERRARAATLRAVLLARQRRFVAAQAAFAEAARLDPALDLSTVPTFWDLERGGHEAAVEAYEGLGRRREALALAAKVHQRYRPRLVPTARPTSTAAG